MASATEDREKVMASDVMAPGADDDRGRGAPPPPRVETGAGFFHIYKSGQGYWTRMLSAAGAALIILFTANFFYQYLPTWSAYLRDHRGALIGVCVGMIAAMALVSYWLMNKPGSVDFLIATDSEMKKVNWTSRQELIGSTKVVIFFLFTIAILLFVIDVVFGYFFAWIHVLKQTPF